jgi:hypothetical protein
MNGDYSHLLHNDRLGLEEEDLNQVVKEVVKAARPGTWSAASTLVV